MPQIEENYIATGKVSYIFYQLPLNSIHPNAQVAAEASECAGAQGKFWEMHDLIFAKQAEWSGSSEALNVLLGYASQVGIDGAAYAACMGEHRTAARVQKDSSLAASVGIGGTPFFVVNQAGTLYAINGAIPYESFRQGLDGLLAPPATPTP